MTQTQLHGIITTVLLPVIATLLALVVAWKPWKDRLLTPRSPVPIALAFGLIVTELGTLGWLGDRSLISNMSEAGGAGAALRALWDGLWPALWPVDVTRRLPHLILLTLVAIWGTSRLPESDEPKVVAARLGIPAALGALAAFMLLWRLHPHAVDTTSLILWMVGSAVGVAGLWSWWTRALLERPGAGVVLSMSALFGGTAGVLFYGAAMAAVSQFSAGFGMCLLAMGVVAWRRPDCVESRLVAGVPAVAIVSLIVIGANHSFADPKPAAFIAVGLAAFACGLSGTSLWSRMPGVGGAIAQVGATAALMVLAIGLAMAEPDEAEDDAGGGYGDWDTGTTPPDSGSGESLAPATDPSRVLEEGGG